MSSRRVTRAASSRASSVAPSEQGSVVSSATPRRKTQARLPPNANPRESTAYGATGVALPSDLIGAGDAPDLTGNLATILGDARTEHEAHTNLTVVEETVDEDEEFSPINLRARRGGARAPQSRASSDRRSRQRSEEAVQPTPASQQEQSYSFGNESSVFRHLGRGRANQGIAQIEEEADSVVEDEADSDRSGSVLSARQGMLRNHAEYRQPAPARMESGLIRRAPPEQPWPWSMRVAWATYKCKAFISWLFSPRVLISLLLLSLLYPLTVGPWRSVPVAAGRSIRNAVCRLGDSSSTSGASCDDVQVDLNLLQAKVNSIANQISTFASTGTVPHSASTAELRAKMVREATLSKAMRRVNHFAKANGAIVRPHTTSPTYQFSKKRAPFFKRQLFWFAGNPLPSPNPPETALQNWAESGDCWCASTDNGKKGISLGILTLNYVDPESIIVEHVPYEGTLHPGAAPKHMELYAKVEHYLDESIKHSEEVFKDSPWGRYEELDRSYVKVAEFKYLSRDGEPSHQIFEPQMSLSAAAGKSAREWVVVARDNWGETDHTCLYRVRLVGRRTRPAYSQ